MGGRKGRDGVEARLGRLSRRLERWRRASKGRAPIPAEMWREAERLAKRSSVYRVASALRLDYASLKERAIGSGGGRPRFVEMSGAQLLGPAPAAGVLLEMAGGDGWRLTVRLNEGARIDLEKLVRAFRGREP